VPLFAIPFPTIDPVLVAVGPFAIRWYALAYIAGILLGWRLVRRLVQRPGWAVTPEAVDDLVFYVTLGIILGGRIGYALFYQPDHYLTHLLDLLAVWRGGMSFHGGLLGVLVATFVFARARGLAFFELTDALAVATPIGLFLGRLANFVNAELWGRATDLPWAVVFPTARPEPRHPSQIYEAALEGVVLFAVMLWFARRPYGPEARGLLSGVFLIGYALARMTAEFFREPDLHIGYLAGGATMGQLLCLPMLALGVFLVARARRRRRGRGEAFG
jgi:phosphatidylglycerol---prolipoprotein diacylglyceryl transferase